jgi:hypothetical protein
MLENWSGNLLFESVQTAKAVLDSIIQKRLEDSPGEEPDQKDKIADRLRTRFEELRRLFQNKEGYLPAAVRFHFLHGVKLDKLTALPELITQNKDNLGDLSMSIDDYSKLPPVRPDDPPGTNPYEKLIDDFTKIVELRKGNWVVQALTRSARKGQIDLKQLYRDSPQELKDRLRAAAARLAGLNKPGFILIVKQGLSGADSIEAIIDKLDKTYASAQTDFGELVEEAYSAYPEVAVLHFDGTVAVFSFRTENLLPKLCSAAVTWCIQPKWYNKTGGGSFWTYASGSLQLGIIDTSVPPDSRFRTVGVTIYPNKKVHLCDQPNSCSDGQDLNYLLGFSTGGLRHSYSQEVVDAIDAAFDSEVSIKKATDPMYKRLTTAGRGQTDQLQAALMTVEELVKNISDFQAAADSQVDQKLRDTANLIISRSLKGMAGLGPKDQQTLRALFIDKMTSGNRVLVSPTSVESIKLVLGGSEMLNVKFIDNLINKTRNFHDMFRPRIRKFMSDPKHAETATRVDRALDQLEVALSAAETLKAEL